MDMTWSQAQVAVWLYAVTLMCGSGAIKLGFRGSLRPVQYGPGVLSFAFVAGWRASRWHSPRK